MKDLARTIRTLAWVAVIAAIYQELKKPPAERTWHGKVGGLIPYDFRIPTPARVKAAYWDPSSDTVFTDKVVGVGWAVNVPVLLRKVDQTLGQYSGVSRSMREEISRRMPQMSGRRPGNGEAEH
ncbi:MAG: hypothetical protein KGJ98_13190 [Chloroflexota bacterium]|nr:hypothetical protein [Chloroflexota bacterium]MDE3103177.1 hypothetical protein [Chloroflexota bacterium]